MPGLTAAAEHTSKVPGESYRSAPRPRRDTLRAVLDGPFNAVEKRALPAPVRPPATATGTAADARALAWQGSRRSVAHRGKQDDLADRVASRQQHDQAVDPQAHAAGGRHALLQRLDEALVEGLDLLLAL